MSFVAMTEAGNGNAYVNINQPMTSLAVAANGKHTIYSLDSVDDKLITVYQQPGDNVIFMEHRNSMVVIVTELSPRKVKIVDFWKQSEISSYVYGDRVLGVKLAFDRLVVCLEDTIFIHNIANMKVIHKIATTFCNSNGLFALSQDLDLCYLAYPSCCLKGDLQIFDIAKCTETRKIHAHNLPLAALAFNSSSKEIATASESGTHIKIFSTQDGSQLFQLVRGYMRDASIISLSFSSCSEYLIASSNTVTVHIFKVDPNTLEAKQCLEQHIRSRGWTGFSSALNNMTRTVTNYLPTQVTKVMKETRSFAKITFPKKDVHRICAITTIEGQIIILIASQEGYLAVYTLPILLDNECNLIKKYDLNNHDDFESATQPTQSNLDSHVIEEDTS